MSQFYSGPHPESDQTTTCTNSTTAPVDYPQPPTHLCDPYGYAYPQSAQQQGQWQGSVPPPAFDHHQGYNGTQQMTFENPKPTQPAKKRQRKTTNKTIAAVSLLDSDEKPSKRRKVGGGMPMKEISPNTPYCCPDAVIDADVEAWKLKEGLGTRDQSSQGQIASSFPLSPALPTSFTPADPMSYDANVPWAAYSAPPSSLVTPPPPSSSPGPVPPLSSAPPITTSTVAEEPVLCPEQAELLELIASGKNVFYTGSAGCGKSTVLKAFVKRLRSMDKRVRILAPTGRAALQVGGTTTWTYAGWTPNHHKKTLEELKEAAHGKFTFKRFHETDVLVVDEISMVENLHFERLNEILKEVRRKPHQQGKAFGGIQIIVTGDFCQLPPVKPFQHCMHCGKSMAQQRDIKDGEITYSCRHGTYRDEEKWAFRSKAWEECNFAHVELKSVHRQKDQQFIGMLQKCRIGDALSRGEIDLLMDHPCKVHNATKLFATRDEVARVNAEAFNKLKTVNHSYWCRDTFLWRRDRHPQLQWKGISSGRGPEGQQPLKALEDHRFGECVELKKGMLVVLLTNLDLGAGLCNGSQGLVCGFERLRRDLMPQAKKGKNEPVNKIVGDRAELKEAEIRAFLEGPGTKFQVWPIVRFHNGATRAIYADCSISELGDEGPYSLLCRTQIPLAPAWAMTIHKSQSLTLDRIIVNLSRAFEEGQVYVALSRATGLQGLKIEGTISGLQTGLGCNPEVQKFLREKFGY